VSHTPRSATRPIAIADRRRELVDDVVPGDRAEDQHEQPRDDDPDRDRPHLDPPPAAREPDGDPPEEEGHDPDPRRDLLEELRRPLRGVELVRGENRDHARVLRQAVGEVPDEVEPLAELQDDGAQVDDDRLVLDAEHVRVVAEDVDELLVRQGDGLPPHGLHARPLEEPVGGAVGELAEARRDRPGQTLLVGRQAVLELGRNVHVGEERVDGGRGDLVPDGVVRDQLGRGLLERLVVERLPVQVAREDRDRREERAEDDEDARQDPAPERCARCLGAAHRRAGAAARAPPTIVPRPMAVKVPRSPGAGRAARRSR
jgi:hypothetical protein